jgi:hypothetical protein
MAPAVRRHMRPLTSPALGRAFGVPASCVIIRSITHAFNTPFEDIAARKPTFRDGRQETVVPLAQKRTAELFAVPKEPPIPDNRALLGNDDSRRVGMRRIHENVPLGACDD